jgi:BASS family bile acid:Na+ symporter
LGPVRRSTTLAWEIDERDRLRALIAIVIPAMAFLLQVTVGLDLTAADFARVRRHPGVVLAGLFAPLMLLPPAALFLTNRFHASPELTASLLLIAACPIGGISTAYTYLARASTALSVTLTGLSCLIAAVTIPVVGAGIEMALGRPFGVAAPLPLLATQVLLVLALPVAIGMWWRRRAPALADRHAPVVRKVAFGVTALVLFLVVASAPDAFVSGLSTTVPLATAFVLVSMAAGWLTGVLVTADVKDRFTLAAEFGTRNIGIAMAIAVTFLGRVEFARFAVTYALVEVPLLIVAALLFRRQRQVIRGAGPFEVRA